MVDESAKSLKSRGSILKRKKPVNRGIGRRKCWSGRVVAGREGYV